jgi:hypothetical protein
MGSIVLNASLRVSFRSPPTAKLKFTALIIDLPLPILPTHSKFTSTANVATAGIKSKGYTERAIVFCFLAACPALTFYPAPAFGCLTGKYDVMYLLAVSLADK